MSYGGIIGQQPALEANGIAYNNSQTSSIITGDNVQTAIDQLFTSVSNGKNKIASAITDKGISTSPNDSFDVMAGNIGKIQSLPKYRVIQDFSEEIKTRSGIDFDYNYPEQSNRYRYIIYIRFKYRKNTCGEDIRPVELVQSPWDFYIPCFMIRATAGNIQVPTKLWFPFQVDGNDFYTFLVFDSNRSSPSNLGISIYGWNMGSNHFSDGIEKLQILYQED